MSGIDDIRGALRQMRYEFEDSARAIAEQRWKESFRWEECMPQSYYTLKHALDDAIKSQRATPHGLAREET